MAVHNLWKLGRCTRAEAGACRETLDTADVVAFEIQTQEVNGLLELLPTKPAVAMAGLRKRSQGLKLVLSHVKSLL
jgi:hypothetical protein